ncbi:LuxR C-terminal-related transcriptional regulator [Actinosynnema sp. NPDC053489]|uniref:LuxR C-terminal-related transcriptional regulator n=1 Tax=Actinosynnema sp. NPDC053489 TaxID=3363916 RepID=UPI0037C5943A
MAKFAVEMMFESDDPRLAHTRPAHRLHWERQAVLGFLSGGGWYTDDRGGLLLCEAPDERAVRRVVQADPYVRCNLVKSVRVLEWTPVPGGLAARSDQPGLIALGGSAVPESRRNAEDSRPALPAASRELTAHESRIAELIVCGRTNREIAAVFGVSVRAVELHITNIYRKLGIARRAQLAGALAA